MTSMDAGVSVSALPSAGVIFRTSSAVRVPAPGRFSTMMVEAYPFISLAGDLATVSVDPPGGEPTSVRAVPRTVCACAGRQEAGATDARPPAQAIDRNRRFVIMACLLRTLSPANRT